MIRRFLTAGLAATALFALAACGDDSDKDSVILPGQVTLPSGVTLPDGSGFDSIPPIAGVSAECMAIANAFAGAATAMSGQGDVSQAEASLAALEGIVPDELKDDARLFAEAYNAVIVALVAHDNDYSKLIADPTAMAALQALDNEDVQAASDNISAYLDGACSTGG
jgi:hypothetical protein